MFSQKRCLSTVPPDSSTFARYEAANNLPNRLSATCRKLASSPACADAEYGPWPAARYHAAEQRKLSVTW